MRGRMLRPTALIFGLSLALAPAAGAVVIDFSTEDDFSTALINGQIVDPTFDALDLEFGNLFSLTSTQIAGSNNGATIFDSDPNGPNSGSQDLDLLVDLGNILILQSNNPGNANDTSVDGSVGLIYDNPNDEADFADRGSLVFSFIGPVILQSFDIVDANGGFIADVILTDGAAGGALTRTYSVNSKFSQDINTCGSCDGFETLDLTILTDQIGEGGGTATAVEDLGFDASDVVKLEIKLIGNPSSGGIDNLTFVPEPSTGVLLALGLLGLSARRNFRRR